LKPSIGDAAVARSKTVQSSTAYFGDFVAVRRGRMFHPNTAFGIRNIEPVIPGRANRRVKIEYDRTLYRQRNLIERMFGRLKINRTIATRYDQPAESSISMVQIATARYWLKFVHTA